MMSFSRPLQASHQHHARSSLAPGCPPLPKTRNVAKMSSSCATRGPVPKEAKQCRPQFLRTLIGPSKINPSRCRNSRTTLQPCSQKLRVCRVPCRRSSNSSKSKIRFPSNCKRTCKPRARASNRRAEQSKTLMDLIGQMLRATPKPRSQPSSKRQLDGDEDMQD